MTALSDSGHLGDEEKCEAPYEDNLAAPQERHNSDGHGFSRLCS